MRQRGKPTLEWLIRALLSRELGRWVYDQLDAEGTKAEEEIEENYVASRVNFRDYLRVFSIIKRQEPKGISFRDLTRYAHMEGEELKQILDHLLETRMLLKPS